MSMKVSGPAFIGAISTNTKDGKESVFAKITVPTGDKGSKEYLYFDCYVSNHLQDKFKALFQDQTFEDEAGKSRAKHELSGVLVDVEIGSASVKPGVNESTGAVYQNGSGFLNDVKLFL